MQHGIPIDEDITIEACLKLTILHLSDLHYASNSWSQNKILKCFLSDLETYVAKNQKIDFVFFTGDIVQSGESSQFSHFKDNVLGEIVRILEIKESQVIFTPGNHDVHRASVSEVARLAFSSLNSPDSVKKIFPYLKRNSENLSGLKNYNDFIDSIDYGATIEKHDLFNIHIFEKETKKVGFAALNSSWSAWGGAEDYGKLVLGDMQLQSAAGLIENCDVKICGFHHPFDWLREFDRISSRIFINSNFDFFFSGHEHEPTPYVHTSTRSCLNLKSGCLYQGSDYFNGYSVVEFDDRTRGCAITYRTYFPKRNEFGSAEDVCRGGKITLSLGPEKFGASLVAASEKVNAMTKISQVYGTELSRTLILSGDNKDLPLRTTFIRPTISTSPESSEGISKTNANFEPGIFVNLDDIIFNNSNYLVLGQKESGKTTLLRYMMSEAINGDSSIETRFPVYIDYVADLENTNSMFEKAVKKYFGKMELRQFDFQKELDEGNVILLIDNYDLKYPRKSRELQGFVSKYPNVKVIITSNESLFDFVSGGPEFSFSCTKVHIHTFKRAHTRDLINRMGIGSDGYDKERILNNVMNGLTACMIPRTPFMITVALSVYQSEKIFKPINKASLVEKFVEILLDKLTLRESAGFVDYRVKEDFLAHVAEAMVLEGKYSFTQDEIEVIAAKYLSDIGSTVRPALFLDYFLRKNVLSFEEGSIAFKLKAFFEFFCAKKMLGDSLFYSRIVSAESMLLFKDEIEFYAGLRRDDLVLLKLVLEKLVAGHSQLGASVDLKVFDTFTTSFSILDSIERKQLVSSLKEKNKDTVGRDRSLDNHYGDSSAKDQSITKSADYKEALVSYVATLVMFGNILKVSELIRDQAEKESLVREFVGRVAEGTVGLMLAGDKIYTIAREDGAGEVPGLDKEAITELLRLLVPVAVTMYVAESFSSVSFSNMYQNLIRDNEVTSIEKLIALALMASADPSRFIDLLRQEAGKLNADSTYLEILTALIISRYSMALLPDKDEESVLDVISDLQLKRMHKKGSKAEINHYKSQIRSQFLNRKYHLGGTEKK